MEKETKSKKMLKWLELEEWVNLPESVQKDIFRFRDLNQWIKRREKKIERIITKTLPELREGKREWEKEMNELYDKLHQFQSEFKFSVSITQSPKYTKNQYQWRVNVTIGEIKRTPYLGNNKTVRRVLDKSIGGTEFSDTEKSNKKSNEISSIIMERVKNGIKQKMNENYEEFIIDFRDKNWKKLRFIDFLK